MSPRPSLLSRLLGYLWPGGQCADDWVDPFDVLAAERDRRLGEWTTGYQPRQERPAGPPPTGGTSVKPPNVSHYAPGGAPWPESGLEHWRRRALAAEGLALLHGWTEKPDAPKPADWRGVLHAAGQLSPNDVRKMREELDDDAEFIGWPVVGADLGLGPDLVGVAYSCRHGLHLESPCPICDEELLHGDGVAPPLGVMAQAERPPPSPLLVTFLYLVGRDHLPLGAVESAVQRCTSEHVVYSNVELEAWARDVARRLDGDPALERQLSEQIGRLTEENARLDERLLTLEQAIGLACDLLAERVPGSTARSPAHNARLHLEAALKGPTPPRPTPPGWRG